MRHTRFFALAAVSAAALSLVPFSPWMARAEDAPGNINPGVVGRDTTGGVLRPAPVAVMVKVDKNRYSPTEVIGITLTVKNTSKQPVTLHFSSGQKYDLELRRGKDAKGTRIWQWSHGRMFAEMLSTVLIAPGKTLTFNESYKPSPKAGDDSMPRLAPGPYLLTGIITTMGATPRPFGTTPILIK